MFYADTIGLDHVLTRLEDFAERHGAELWSPAPLLKRLAGSGKTFSSFDREAGVAGDR
jgi:3-hydroxyacyl-CoA dehydrogenase